MLTRQGQYIYSIFVMQLWLVAYDRTAVNLVRIDQSNFRILAHGCGKDLIVGIKLMRGESLIEMYLHFPPHRIHAVGWNGIDDEYES